MSDDTDFAWLSCYGGRTPTPHIDRLAARGVRFTHMTCSAPACTPSRYSYLTGRYAGRCSDATFLAANPVDEPYNLAWNAVLNADVPSLGRALRAGGYRTGMVGKWHCGRSRRDLALPDLRADDDPVDPEVDAKLRQHQAALQAEVRHTGGFDYAAAVIWGDNESFPVARLRAHNLEWITQGALDFLNTCSEQQPFFLYVTPTAMHGPPHDGSYELDERYTQGGKRELPFDCHPPRAEMRQRLAARGLPYNHDTVGITWIDDQVGAIVQKLEAMGAAGNTVVIYKVDHNTEPGKGTCYQRGVRIPLVLAWPGGVDPGSTCDAWVQNVDLAPTLLDIAQVPVPDTMAPDGVSWLPLLTGEADASPGRDLFFEFGYARALLHGKWKYVALRYPQRLMDAMATGELLEAPNHVNSRLQGQMNIAMEVYPSYFDPDQLFDLEQDPDEQRNLAEDPAHAAVLALMKERLQRHLDTFDHPFDLTVPDFMRTVRYRELCDATRQIGTQHLSWWPKEAWWEDV
jgi:arylsulfatase A-like enzyme